MKIEIGKTYQGKGKKLILRKVESEDATHFGVKETKYLTGGKIITNHGVRVTKNGMRMWAKCEFQTDAVSPTNPKPSENPVNSVTTETAEVEQPGSIEVVNEAATKTFEIPKI